MSPSVMEIVLVGVLLFSPWLALGVAALALPRFIRARMDAAGDEVASKVHSAVAAAVEEALPRVREEVAGGLGEAGEALLPRLRSEVEGGVRDAAEAALPQFRVQVRDGFSQAMASAVTGGVLGEAGEELVRKGGGVLDALLGRRREEED